MHSNNDDDDLFNPTASSHLASLFSNKQKPDATLIYTAPKQPKTSTQDVNKTPMKPTLKSSLICSKFVNVFKLVDTNYIPQGKCGLAIIGNDNLNVNEVMVYKSKQDIITRTKLSTSFIFTVQNSSGYFSDEQTQRWLVEFDNADDINEFAEKIAARKGNVAYSEAKTSSDAKAESSILNDDSSMPSKEKDSDSASDHSSVANIMLTYTGTTRANILSRMAKMGQSILPANVAKASSGNSDSESDATNKKPVVKKRQKFVVMDSELRNQPAAAEFVTINGQLVPVSTLAHNLPYSNPIINSNSPYINMNNMQNIPPPMMMNQHPQLLDSLHVFIAENRTHNCEMRMNMSQLSAKIDRVLQTLPDLDAHDTYLKNESKKDDQEIFLNYLKSENKEQKATIFEQKGKITELEEKNKNLTETVNRLEMELKDAQQSNSGFESMLSRQQEAFAEVEQLCKEERQKVSDSKITIDQLHVNITDLSSQLVDKNLKANMFDKKLKQSMNLLFQQIMENFLEENATFSSLEIKQMISQKIKNGTFQILEEFQQNLVDQELPLGLESSSGETP